jgi:hypothetical protein
MAFSNIDPDLLKYFEKLFFYGKISYLVLFFVSVSSYF